MRADDVQISKDRLELRQTRQKLEEATKQIKNLRADDVRIGQDRAELRQARQDVEALSYRLEWAPAALRKCDNLVNTRTEERDSVIRERDAVKREWDGMERGRDAAEHERDAMAKKLADADAALDRWKRGVHFQIFEGFAAGLQELRRANVADVKKRLPELAETDDPAGDD